MFARTSQSTQTEPTSGDILAAANLVSGYMVGGSNTRSGLVSPFLPFECCPLGTLHHPHDNVRFPLEPQGKAQQSKSLRSSYHCNLDDNEPTATTLGPSSSKTNTSNMTTLTGCSSQQSNNVSQQHRFIVRTLPGYLNLSPRSSYHRLNLRSMTTMTTAGQDLEGLGETILLCCPVTDSNESFWLSEDRKKSQPSMAVDSVSVSGTSRTTGSLASSQRPPIPPKPSRVKLKLAETTNPAAVRYANELAENILEALKDKDVLMKAAAMPKSRSEYSNLVYQDYGKLKKEDNEQKEKDDDDSESLPTPPPIDYDQVFDNEMHNINYKEKLTQVESNATRSINSDEYFLGVGPGGNNFNSSYYASALYQCEHKSFSESELYVQMKENFNSGQSKFFWTFLVTSGCLLSSSIC